MIRKSVFFFQRASHVPLLPPAYVVRREGNSFTLFVSSHRGGYPYPIMLCNISQNVMGQPGGGGYPARSSRGEGVPCQVQPWGGTLAGGGYPGQGGTQLGQHREYLLHGGRYASCVHVGGLSCFPMFRYFCVCVFSCSTDFSRTVPVSKRQET